MSTPKALLEHARNAPEYWHRLILATRTSMKDNESTPITSCVDQCFARTLAIIERTRLAVLGCIEFRSPVDDLSDWREQGVSCSRESLEYLCGDWREAYSDEMLGIPRLTMADARRRLPWVDTFRFGLMWACALDLETDQKRLLAWPNLDVLRDSDTICERFDLRL